MWMEAVWLGLPEEEIKRWNILQGDMNGRFAYYRCELELEEEGELVVQITANSRYRLWVNEIPVLSGPCKGDRHRQYYETVDLSDRLKLGKNVFAVQVLFCDQNAVVNQADERAPIFAAASLPGGHRLALEGSVVNQHGEVIGQLTTGTAPWRVYLDGSFYLKAGDEATVNFGAVREEIDFRKVPIGWKKEVFDDSHWLIPWIIEPAKQDAFSANVGLYGSYRLKEREIPLLFETEKEFFGDKKELYLEGFSAERLHVNPGEKKEFVLNAGEHTNAYMIYQFEKGAGAKVTITYSEKYRSADGKEIERDDKVSGILKGLTDKIILNGESLIYEPFWFRTFRFIMIEIQAEEEEVILHLPKMRMTGYPLHIQSEVRSDEPWVEKLWDMCLRTLQNCMAETYMDCPFYEQMQFSMDTRLQALFTYAVSQDIRLVKKALEDFHNSMIPDGLIQGKYPSGFPQIISTFSLHYIFMLEEYYRQTGDLDTLKRYRVDVDAILEYYSRKIGAQGLVEHLGYWEFVDWQEQWKENMGVPTAAISGPSAIINLMYAYGLQSGAYIYEVTQRKEMAAEYRKRQMKILEGVQRLCWDEKNGLYREGPGIEQYSQHAQAWAVLNGMLTRDEAVKVLKRTLNIPDVLQCSFSTGYELFRAFEWVEDYEDTKILMEKWIHLIDWKCTTCPEEPENGRSECHAWSALPMYEFLRSMAGIKMGETAWKSVIIQPHMEYINSLHGKAVIPGGVIEFNFQKKQGNYYVKLPQKMKGRFILPTGKEAEVKEGENFIVE